MGNENELMHYGVLGMKWHQHRGRSSKALAKAQKKMTKLDNKNTKAQTKKMKNSRIHLTDYGVNKYKRSVMKADRARAKATKWYKKVEKTLGSQAASKLTTSSGVAAGKRYVEATYGI